jgi:hypothetical protein
MLRRVPPVWWGAGIGLLVSLASGLIYLLLLHEPGSAFYPFAALAFVAGPLVGGIASMRKSQARRTRAFFASSAIVLGIVGLLFILTYMVLPDFERTSVQLPEFCDGFAGSFSPPAALAYSLPDGSSGVLLASNAGSALVAVIDYKHPPFPATVFLIDKGENRIIGSMSFDNDVISAAMDDETLVLYNDKIGYWVDARTGEPEQAFLTIDNFGGLSESDRPVISRASSGHWYLETTAVISSWNVDGTVKSRRHLTFDGIARGCFIDGETHDVLILDKAP